MFNKKYLLNLVILALLAGCAGKSQQNAFIHDTPQYHYVKGMQQLDANNVASAKNHLSRSLKLNSKFAPSLAAIQLLTAIQTVPKSTLNRDKLSTAYWNAENDAEKFIVAVNALRAELVTHSEGWQAECKKWYSKANKNRPVSPSALPYYNSSTVLEYLMATMYFKDNKYADAKKHIQAVQSMPTDKWHQPTEILLESIQKTERTASQYTKTKIADQLIAKQTVSRADVAALLVNELPWEKITPFHTASNKTQHIHVPTDITTHPLKEDIIQVLQWNIRGLTPVYSAKEARFKPETPLSRQELALVLEDILLKATDNPKLATQFLGQEKSPFSDVAPTQASYNAIMTCISRNLLQANLQGQFRPNEYLTGADLLESIIRLRNALAQ